MIYSFLLIGQSNMSGRGDPADVSPFGDKRIKVLKNGRWRKVFVPLHSESVNCGTCLAESFAQLFIEEHPDDTIGLIPCADGGSRIDMWKKGQPLYDHAVFQAQMAMRNSQLVAILWHQGESDCYPDRYPQYEQKLTELVKSLRQDLGQPEIPFIVGGIGDFIPKFVSPTNGAVYGNYVHINAALQKVAAELPNMAFVPAHGLTDIGDDLHFNAKSLREFGVRYYNAFKTLNYTLTDLEKEDTDTHTELEHL